VWAIANGWWEAADADTRAKAAGAPQYIIEDLGLWPTTPDCDTVTTIAPTASSHAIESLHAARRPSAGRLSCCRPPTDHENDIPPA
jgi:hypothetical protein